jgi:hypothetical protein
MRRRFIMKIGILGSGDVLSSIIDFYLDYLCLSVEDLKKYGKTKRRAQGIFIYTLCYWDLNIDM